MILGTAAYMSPEKAVGRPVDRRSDIFSFGAVLYEMLAGKSAFVGSTTPDVLEAVVKNEPDWSALPADTSDTIQRLLRRCLAKSESNNKLDKCLRRAYSKVDDQVHARAVCFRSGKAMAEGIPHLE
jgi:eukaryotic-like serine/threonine-protein kinase